jgi:hypothetical protein
MSEKFEHIIKFRPAYDKRNPEPSKNYGVHCVDMLMVLKGSKGAISFTIFTGWYLPHVAADWRNRGLASLAAFDASGADIGYHSRKPLREWQNDTNKNEHCEWCDNEPCWYDGSGLAASELFKRFVKEGEEIVWSTLEEWYHSEFDTNVSDSSSGGKPE